MTDSRSCPSPPPGDTLAGQVEERWQRGEPPDPDTLVAEAGRRTPAEVAKFSQRLRKNGVWSSDGMTACDWEDEEHGHIAFLLDVLVALGLVRYAGYVGRDRINVGVKEPGAG
jgi:hypothetical protein